MTMTFRQAAITLLAVGALASCAQQAGTDQLASDAQPAAKAAVFHATVKPGAAVSFSHTDSGALAVGEQGYVEFTVDDAYEGGILTLEAIGGDGLSVFGNSVSATFDMASAGAHVWRVSFRAEQEGVQYLRLRADAAPDDALASSRSYAARIDVGDISAVQSAKVSPLTVTPAGENIVIMEAEETIE